jgi:hypothetical protein
MSPRFVSGCIQNVRFVPGRGFPLSGTLRSLIEHKTDLPGFVAKCFIASVVFSEAYVSLPFPQPAEDFDAGRNARSCRCR